MQISESQLSRIFFQEKFYTLYELKKDIPIILNSLHIYAIKNDEVYTEVDFDIFTDTKGIRYVSPRYNPAHCDHFVLTGERLAMCKTIKIKTSDYVDVTNLNGDFTFTVENNK
jgi:hypothetical protein